MLEYGTMLDASVSEEFREVWYGLTNYLGSKPVSWYLLVLVVVVVLGYLISKK